MPSTRVYDSLLLDFRRLHWQCCLCPILAVDSFRKFYSPFSLFLKLGSVALACSLRWAQCSNEHKPQHCDSSVKITAGKERFEEGSKEDEEEREEESKGEGEGCCGEKRKEQQQVRVIQ